MTASSGKPFSASSRPLGAGEVHLWLCDRDDAAGLDLSVLSDEEQARAARWRGDGPGDFALGRALLRLLLSEVGGDDPGDWVFEHGPHGKPVLVAAEPAIQFNLSHSGRWLAVALALDVPVGVDIQQFEWGRPLRRLARRYFSEAECAVLDSLQGEDFDRHFYRLWSLKEAWTKARGGALPTALGSAAFSLDAGELVCLPPGMARGTSLWLLEAGEYALAVCGLGEGLSLHCRGGFVARATERAGPRLLAHCGAVSPPPTG